MSQNAQAVPKFRFLTSFVLPALLVFLVPVLSYFFFHHAQDRFDDQIRTAIIEQIRADRTLTEEKRAQLIAFFTETPFSQLLDNEQLAQALPTETRFHYATFRWMMWLAIGSVLASFAVFVVAGICVALSLHSQFVQYLSLSVGWYVLRLFGAAQVALQGILLVALSYWVTALWFHFYSIKLILVVGIMAVMAVCVVIAAIFRRIKENFVVEGQVIAPDTAGPVWSELRRICEKVGTEPPDQIIVGIDDNFFVSEQPVTVGGQTYHGRTLFVSLSLLKQLQGSEAEAVLAHEMAHFSGQDTLYSRKIAPLLTRYDHYLAALHSGGVTRPVFYFMLCFRALYQLSLGKRSRQREFRADQIAVETTSARAVAGALLRTVAYSKYRKDVEQDFFKQERTLESANVCERIEQGFRQYAACFASSPDIGQLAPAHPFDSHPPLSQRLEAIGIPLESPDAQALLASGGDGRWYHFVPLAQQVEQTQWQEFEERFRQYHAQSLPYRFLPETAEELAIVVQAFPPLTFAGSQGELALDHEKIAFTKWPDPIHFAEITNLAVDDNHVLRISYQRQGKHSQSIKLAKFAYHQQVLDLIGSYYGRYRAAVEYQQRKRAATIAPLPADGGG